MRKQRQNDESSGKMQVNEVTRQKDCRNNKGRMMRVLEKMQVNGVTRQKDYENNKGRMTKVQKKMQVNGATRQKDC